MKPVPHKKNPASLSGLVPSFSWVSEKIQTSRDYLQKLLSKHDSRN